MQVPKRKPGKYAFTKPDFHLTQSKLDQLKKQLTRLKEVSRPPAISELQRLAELGDFSENAAYQMAKGRLRGINRRIDELEFKINRAVIINPADTDSIQVGHTVTVELDGAQKIFLILGSAETDPTKGVISHNSPIGSSLIGHKVGDVVSINIKKKKIECRIISIE